MDVAGLTKVPDQGSHMLRGLQELLSHGYPP